jgi:hypothetical protein
MTGSRKTAASECAGTMRRLAEIVLQDVAFCPSRARLMSG